MEKPFKREEIEKIFILRPDNLGDVVLFSGALRHIKEYYSSAKISLCVKKYARNLLEKCPYVNEIIDWEDLIKPLPNWLTRFKGLNYFELVVWLLFFERTIKKNYEFDLFLLPVRSPTRRMHLCARAIQAKYKYAISGDTCNQTSAVDRSAKEIYTERFKLPKELKKQHELNINSLFLNYLGIDTIVEDLWPVFWTDMYDREWATINISRSNDSFVLAICPGIGSGVQKKYPAKNYAHALSALRDIKISVLLFGNIDEKDQCDEVGKAVAQCENVISVSNLAGMTTIRKLVEGLRICDMVISNDTAALQIAVALKKPTVGIIGGEYFGRFYPWGDNKINLVAHKKMDCYWCNGECIFSEMRCVIDIEPEIITSQIKDLIKFIRR